MIVASPHRGERVQSLVNGSATLAIGWADEKPDASLFIEDGLAVAVTGVIDNLTDLVKDLQHSGRFVHSTSPAAVLAAAFRAYGEGTPGRLRGVFAAAVTDGSHLHCFRDHLGFATLFFHRSAQAHYVASEAKQVIEGSGILGEPDMDVLERTYFQELDDQTPSALRGVSRLPKATTLTVGSGPPRLNLYWDPEPLLESARYGREDLQERFDQLMKQAVARVLTGHDAVSLSGGIDSPVVAAYGAPEHLVINGRPLGALSAEYPDYPSVDERSYVELVAQDLGMPLHTYVHRSGPLQHLGEWARLADGPVPTISLPHYEENYREARKLGYRTVLSGELAEFVMDMPQYVFPHLLFRGRLSAVAAQIQARRSRGASFGSIGRLLLSSVAPAPVVALKWKFRTAGVPDWLDRRRVNRFVASSIVPARQRWRKIQLGALRGPGLSVEAESICQEVCGVRARRPWADIDLWEFFLSLPAEIKFPDNRSKTLVRQLARGKVPDTILDRQDKTLFDESVMAHIDYGILRRWLVQPKYRLAGVRYDLLQDRLAREDLQLFEFMWAKDLASIHAFLARW